MPPGTALSAAARSVAAGPLDTLFSSGRTGWAPPGPRRVASLPPEADAVLPLAAGVLLAADALSVLAMTPPMIAPAASRPASPTRLFLRPPVSVESYIV